MSDPRKRRSAKWSAKACDICGESRKLESLGARSYLAPTRRYLFEFELRDVLCLRCGFVFAGDIPDEPFLFDYYQDSFTSLSEYRPLVPDFNVESRLGPIRQHLSAGSTILEVGANTGSFCTVLERAGYEAHGIDPVSDESTSNVGRLGSQNTNNRRYDASASYYVAEHVPFGRLWLEDVKKSLKDGGLLFIEVPHFESHPAESLNKEHLLHFTPRSLTQLLNGCGFQVLEENKSPASVYFGFSTTARLTSAGAAERIEAPKLDQTRLTYKRGIELIGRQAEQYRQKAASLLTAIKRLSRREKVKVLFWAANEHASGIANELRSLVEAPFEIIDSSTQKIGCSHDGFNSPVQAPRIATKDESHRLFVLCSPVWNVEIRKQIEAMGLENITIIDGLNAADIE